MYLGTHYFPGVAPGTVNRGYRCENLEAQTFASESFDLVITQDVFEHVLDPERAFAEVARTLRSGGAHVFTVPWYSQRPTVVRAVREGDGIRYLEKPVYHGNPLADSGSLVVRDWGWDLCDVIFKATGMTTAVIRIQDRRLGILGEFLDVLVSRKA
jgi:SAM-dependent methyltransferase